MSGSSMTKTQRFGNIVDMAVMFTAMLRLFKPGSKALIKSQVLDFLAGLTENTGKADFNRMHDEFVKWFMANVHLRE